MTFFKEKTEASKKLRKNHVNNKPQHKKKEKRSCEGGECLVIKIINTNGLVGKLLRNVSPSYTGLRLRSR